jgi:mevalonate kinase
VKIVLTNTKVPRSTKVLVAGVQGLLEGMPGVITPIFASIEDISQRFLSLIGDNSNGGGGGGSSSSSDRAAVVREMSQLVRINHCLLNAIGVGHRSLDEVFAVSARHGFACKLTGAGGGGCAITLLDDTKDSWEADREVLREEIEGLGYDTFLSGIGGDGVQWHS